MSEYPTKSCTAFADTRCVATGGLVDVAIAVKQLVEAGDTSTILVFDDATAQPVELDLRGSADDVVKRHAALPASSPDLLLDTTARVGTGAAPEAQAHRSPGRPKLGVVAREVTLLPRHWEWLAAQPGGASVTLRKLVEQARKQGSSAERARTARDTTYRFAIAMAGNDPGFEEAMRALYAGDEAGFEKQTALWPADVRRYARTLAADAFPTPGQQP